MWVEGPVYGRAFRTLSNAVRFRCGRLSFAGKQLERVGDGVGDRVSPASTAAMSSTASDTTSGLKGFTNTLALGPHAAGQHPFVS